MIRRTLKKRKIRKLTRTGGGKSISVTLPIEYVRDLRWKDRQKVTVRKSGKKLIIEDWQK
jgi:virulence-associated protein VagC